MLIAGDVASGIAAHLAGRRPGKWDIRFVGAPERPSDLDAVPIPGAKRCADFAQETACGDPNRGRRLRPLRFRLASGLVALPALRRTSERVRSGKRKAYLPRFRGN